MSDNFLDDKCVKVDTSLLKKLSPPNNFHFKFDIPKQKEIKITTPEERMRPLITRLDDMQKELESQTSELLKLRYENIKLNAQIETQNKVIHKQLSELEELESIKYKLNQTRQTIIDNNKNYWIRNFIAGAICSVLSVILTMLLT